MRHLTSTSLLTATACVLLLVGVVAFAQSGRRGSKSPSVPTATPEPSPTEKKPVTDVARIPLILGASRDDVFMGIPVNIYDSVVDSCAIRLQDASVARVQTVGNGFSRSEAIQRAKNEDEGYVVWLHLRGDDLSGGYAGNLDSIYIEYFVFEHTTAKVKTQGNCYQGTYRKGPVVMGSPTGRSSTAVVEDRLKLAATDAGERILKALHLASASDVPPTN